MPMVKVPPMHSLTTTFLLWMKSKMKEEITAELSKRKHNYTTIIINAVEIISVSVKN